MRLSSTFLVAARALLVLSDVVSAATVTKVSAMSVPNVAKPVEVAPVKDARLLRSESRKQTDVEDFEDEERKIQTSLIDDAFKGLGRTDDAAKKLLANDDAMAKKLAALNKQQGEADNAKFLANLWMRRNKRPEDLRLLTKTPVNKKAYQEFLVQYLKKHHSLKPGPQANQKITREGARIQRQIENADDDVKFLVNFWITQKKTPEDLRRITKNEVSKQAYDLFNAQYPTKRHSLNPSG
uniref:RxLR effector protein n=1 Tax=Phytophthora infestans TaxID=4787 RepID=A0A411NJG0_PHYIN|nr:effector protein AvrSmira1 [Phytophthora infestans]